jgi:hypothetical protein
VPEGAFSAAAVREEGAEAGGFGVLRGLGVGVGRLGGVMGSLLMGSLLMGSLG